ncbi:MAG: FG-GAP-like repeat-containing protein [Oscillospiraceae bacterium]|nr:FG-GAP-like repeat-containing protein [Oscillospiraceae bacterium]
MRSVIKSFGISNSGHDGAATSMARKYDGVNTIATQCGARALRAREVRGTALPRTDDFHNNKIIVVLTVVVVLFFICSPSSSSFYVHAAPSDVSLSLMYNYGGCESNLYTAESYYVTPIVKDIYQNGSNQIIYGNYSVIVTDATGNTIWRVNGGYDRTKPYATTGGDIGRVNKIVVADIDGDGYDDIIVAHANGTVSALSHEGYMKPGWPQKLKYRNGLEVSESVSSIVVSDLNNNGKCEIIVGAATTTGQCVWVYRHNGEPMPGWPQLYGQKGNSFGVFMDGVAVGDITGDGKKEILVATDTPFLNVYDINGKAISTNHEVFSDRVWGQVGLWEDYVMETGIDPVNQNLDWESSQMISSRSENYLGQLGHSVVKVVDIDNNGNNEVLVSAVIVDKIDDGATKNKIISSRYMSVFIFNGDRTRYKGWEKAPSSLDFMGPPLVQDPKHMAYYVQAVPVVADLDNDGTNEILINTYDGKIHAFSINDPTKEFGNFPFFIPQHAGVTETPNEVVCVDINGDGKKEIIFTSNTRPTSGQGEPSRKGNIYILNYDGALLMSSPLPDGYLVYETKLPAYTNASLSAPVVADIDKDGQYEIVINTKYSGICVFKINGSKVSADATGVASTVSGAPGASATTATATSAPASASSAVPPSPPGSPPGETLVATPTTSTILLNGRNINFSAYNIDDSNYFKLRDLAWSLNNTNNQFAIGWDSANDAISLVSNQPYVPTGQEMAGASGGNKTPAPTSSKVFLDGREVHFTAYNIDDNNYFKLRDIGGALGFEVDWDEASNTIIINTN